MKFLLVILSEFHRGRRGIASGEWRFAATWLIAGAHSKLRAILYSIHSILATWAGSMFWPTRALTKLELSYARLWCDAPTTNAARSFMMLVVFFLQKLFIHFQLREKGIEINPFNSNYLTIIFIIIFIYYSQTTRITIVY